METDKGHDTLTLTASAEEVELSEVDYSDYGTSVTIFAIYRYFAMALKAWARGLVPHDCRFFE